MRTRTKDQLIGDRQSTVTHQSGRLPVAASDVIVSARSMRVDRMLLLLLLHLAIEHISNSWLGQSG